MSTSSSYIFLEVCILLLLFSFWDERFNCSRIKERGLLRGVIILFIIYTVVDQVALSLGLWKFPEGRTLGITAFRLPIEEYLAFIIHGLLTFTLVNLMDRDK